MSDKTLASTGAFHAFVETLAGMEQSFLDPMKGMDGRGIVQGYRHLLHLLSYGLDCYLDSDPERPAFVPLASPAKKMLGDNTDSLYHFTQIRGDRAYRISGRRGNDCYFSICAYGGKPDGEWSTRITVNLNHRSIAFDSEGMFSVVLTPQPSGPGEIELPPDTVCVITRQYFTDRAAAVPARIAIEPLAAPPAPAPEDDDELARRMGAVATFVRQSCQIVPLPATFNVNTLGEPFGFTMNGYGWGTPDNIYAIGTFDLADDECLVITGRSPACAYWGVQTWNHYMQSFDYRHHLVSRNHTQVRLEADGTFVIPVGPRDPGHPNWVGTAGHNRGIVFCRWLLADGHPEQPRCRVEKLNGRM